MPRCDRELVTSKILVECSAESIPRSSGSGNYSYPASGAGSVRPYAVKSITGLVNGFLNPNYKYDANGNLTCMYTGANCTGAGIIRDTNTYWSFDMTKTVSEGTTGLDFQGRKPAKRLAETGLSWRHSGNPRKCRHHSVCIRK